ncbi:MAG TPA: hypothetical protein VFB03_01735, partial [Candidatus Saccharimonadales bacterium]|nr:hypothetical protein [Candidatus Saccharimonadales bacterium]
SKQTDFYPRPPAPLLNAAIENVVMPTIERSFDQHGVFLDTADRSIFFCVNSKHPQSSAS